MSVVHRPSQVTQHHPKPLAQPKIDLNFPDAKLLFRLDKCDISGASTKSTSTNRIRGFSQFCQTNMDPYRFPLYAPNVQNKQQKVSAKTPWNVVDDTLTLPSSSSSWKEIYRGEKVTYRASKLLEGSVYRFRISSSNNSGDGQFSAPIEIKTLRTNPPVIKNAPAVKIEAKEAIINWSQSLTGKSLTILVAYYFFLWIILIFRSNAKRSSI